MFLTQRIWQFVWRALLIFWIIEFINFLLQEIGVEAFLKGWSLIEHNNCFVDGRDLILNRKFYRFCMNWRNRSNDLECKYDIFLGNRCECKYLYWMFWILRCGIYVSWKIRLIIESSIDSRIVNLKVLMKWFWIWHIDWL